MMLQRLALRSAVPGGAHCIINSHTAHANTESGMRKNTSNYDCRLEAFLIWSEP